MQTQFWLCLLFQRQVAAVTYVTKENIDSWWAGNVFEDPIENWVVPPTTTHFQNMFVFYICPEGRGANECPDHYRAHSERRDNLAIDVSRWDVSSITNFRNMLIHANRDYACNGAGSTCFGHPLQLIGLENWNVPENAIMENMFGSGCTYGSGQHAQSVPTWYRGTDCPASPPRSPHPPPSPLPPPLSHMPVSVIETRMNSFDECPSHVHVCGNGTVYSAEKTLCVAADAPECPHPPAYPPSSPCTANPSPSLPCPPCPSCPSGESYCGSDTTWSTSTQKCELNAGSNCPDGQEDRGDGICISCQVGEVSTGGQPCTKCTSGMISNAPDQLGGTECLFCPEGRAASSNGLECVACPLGKQSRADEYRVFTQGACQNCDRGTYAAEQPYLNEWNETFRKCENCPAGKYQASYGMRTCTNCWLYSQSPSEGAITCDYCANGYEANSDHTGCQICPQGKYSFEHSCMTCGTDNRVCSSEGAFGNIMADPGCVEPLPDGSCPSGKGRYSG